MANVCVVVGLDCLAGLQSARVLAARGVPVVGVARDVSHYCARTNACTEVIAADPATDDGLDALEALGRRMPQKAMLLPCTDMSVLALAGHRERLERYFHVPLPSAPTVATLLDKASFHRFASEHGIPVPRTIVVTDDADARRAGGALRFPCVVKPAVKTDAWELHAPSKVVTVDSAHAWEELFPRARTWADVLVIQEWVPGGDDELYSCNCYFSADTEPLAAFVSRKLRQWPPQQGVSTLGEEVRNDEVAHITLRLFREAGFRGLGYVEVKRNVQTGELVVIEPNVGRPTGRSAIAEIGGVELLLTAYSDTVGLPLPRNRQQQYTGAKWVHLRRDVQAAVHYWRRGELSSVDWIRSWRGLRSDAVFALRDQRPFWTDLQNATLAAAVRLRQRG